VAYFGQKDAQQVMVIRRLVTDLNIPVRIEVCPTVREFDGLALSSRNVHLDRSERERATALYRALQSASDLAKEGEQSAAVLVRSAAEQLRSVGITPEYLTLLDAHSLQPLSTLDRPGLMALAAHIGKTRLIDNVVLHPLPTSPSGSDQTEREALARCTV
jgi:pantoate--beta-alanine ligase